MAPVAEVQNTKSLPERIHRELRKGETIYHSLMACHVSKKFPDGKWIAQVRRDDERGKLIKYPVKGFGTPKDALDYIVSLRPDAKGRVASARQGEPTVADLYNFIKKHRQKRIGERTKAEKESRWRLHIEPEWGHMPISQVTRRLAQEWLTDTEEKISAGKAGTLGLAQLEKIRTDLHAMYESADSFSRDYEDRRNPFADLDFIQRPPRPLVTIESQHFPALVHACDYFVDEGLCTEWIAELFLSGLLSGLREGELLALCDDQIDFEHGAIVVDRALRRYSRAIDPKTRLEFGPVQRQAINYPKGGTPTDQRIRVVPMSDQLAEILKRAVNRRSKEPRAEWNYIWGGNTGKLRELSRFTTAWNNLRDRLNEVAQLAPLKGPCNGWPEIPSRRGRLGNSLIELARAKANLRLPDQFENIDFRDTRSSFSSYANEVGISQATREDIMGHEGRGITNAIYTEITSVTFQDARRRLTEGWSA